MRLIPGNIFDSDRAFTGCFVNINQLARGGTRIERDYVAEQHGERFSADQMFGHKDGVSEPERLFLPGVTYLNHIANFADHLRHFWLALFF